MPKFTAMAAEDVLIGRARLAAEERAPYEEHLNNAEAGRLELARGENPTRVKRMLGEASKHTGVRVRSSWEAKDQKVLLWKRVGR